MIPLPKWLNPGSRLLRRRLLALCITARAVGSYACGWLRRDRMGTALIIRHAAGGLAQRVPRRRYAWLHAVDTNNTVWVALCSLLSADDPEQRMLLSLSCAVLLAPFCGHCAPLLYGCARYGCGTWLVDYS